MRARLARAVEALEPAVDTRLTLGNLWAGSLSTVCGPEVCGGGELVAGVISRFGGPLPAIGLFAMEPEDALSALRTGFEDCEPLAAYVALGSEALAAVARALSESRGVLPGGDPAFRPEGEASLEEDSVIGTLLRTHAPSDTTVVALRLDLQVRESVIPAYVYMLVEPKLFAGMLASVAHP